MNVKKKTTLIHLKYVFIVFLLRKQRRCIFLVRITIDIILCVLIQRQSKKKKNNSEKSKIIIIVKKTANQYARNDAELWRDVSDFIGKKY